MKHLLCTLLLIVPAMAHAFEATPSEAELVLMQAADVVILGEVHDNPAHHKAQADLVAQLKPAALVIEMLGTDKAAQLAADPAGFAEEWNASGWPDYDDYRPIFETHNGAVLGAAVPRDIAKATYSDGVAVHFDGDVAAYGLDQPLPADEQATRIELQFLSHCEAMPRTALGGMVEVQRLRDASLAASVVEALDTVGGPVVVITGNGHARTDWGVPAYLARVRPDLEVVTLGQAEDGVAPEGGFDVILDAPAAKRPDPCEAFK